VGYCGNAIHYLVTVPSAMLLSVPAAKGLGLKGALMVGMALYVIYICLFTAAAVNEDPITQKLIFGIGSISGGSAAGLLWTAQGGYFARTALYVARREDRQLEEATGELAAEFALYYLFFEFMSKVFFSVLLAFDVAIWVASTIYSVIGAISACMLSRLCSIECEKERNPSPMSMLFTTIQLWKDPTLWFLSLTNVAFGFSSAYIHGYFNVVHALPELGDHSIGFLVSATVSSATLLAAMFRVLSHRKFPVLIIGAMSLMAIPFLVITTGCCNGWGLGIIIIYLLQGAGRAVYESTNKAIFSDFFKSDKAEAAFANCFVQMASSNALFFFLSNFLQRKALHVMLVGTALCAPLGYIAALMVRRQSTMQEGHALIQGKGKYFDGP